MNGYKKTPYILLLDFVEDIITTAVIIGIQIRMIIIAEEAGKVKTEDVQGQPVLQLLCN